MGMRVALIADIHGNMVALDAVLADCERVGYDQMICLGDVAFGEEPQASLERVRELGCPVVMGNTDARMINPDVPPSVPGAEKWVGEVARWCMAQLKPTDHAFLRTFVPTFTLDLDNQQTLLCYHGSPRSYFETIFPTTPQAKVAEIFAGIKATVAAGGHTHHQMMRRLQDMTILNVGSVGRPYNYDTLVGDMPRILPWAEYTVLTVEQNMKNAISVDLRRVPVDTGQIVQRARASGMPDVERWIAGLKRIPHSLPKSPRVG